MRLGGIGNRLAAEIEAAHRVRDARHDPRSPAARRHAHRVRPRPRDPLRARGDRRGARGRLRHDGRAARAPTSSGCRSTTASRELKTVDRRALRRPRASSSGERAGSVAAGWDARSTTCIELLELEPLEVNLFRGVSPDEDRQRVFGGQVAGQALVAAGRTVDPTGRVHSLHAYFLRPGDPTSRSSTRSTASATASSFTTRRVVAIQHGRAIFNLSASFQIDEPGPEHQDRCPTCPAPRTLPTFRERLEPLPRPVRSPRSSTGSARAADRLACRRADPRWLEPDAARAGAGRVDPGQRRAARRPAAARVRRRLRVRPHAARHRDAAARATRGTTTGS